MSSAPSSNNSQHRSLLCATVPARVLLCVVLLVSATLLLAGCFDSDKPAPEQPANGTPVAPGTPTGTPGTSEEQDDEDEVLAPELSLSVNGFGEAQLYRRWPLIVRAYMLHPQGWSSESPGEPMVIDAGGASRPWGEVVRLEVTDAGGAAQSWPLQLASAPTTTVTLQGEGIAELAWWVTPEDTAAIAPGSYEVRAVLDTTSSTAQGAWKGTSESTVAIVLINPEPASLSQVEESTKYQLETSYDLLRGDRAAAMAKIDALLARQPEDILALEFKGDLLVAAGDEARALEVYNRAVMLFAEKYPDAQEPPTALLHKHRALLYKQLPQRP